MSAMSAMSVHSSMLPPILMWPHMLPGHELQWKSNILWHCWTPVWCIKFVFAAQKIAGNFLLFNHILKESPFWEAADRHDGCDLAPEADSAGCEITHLLSYLQGHTGRGSRIHRAQASHAGVRVFGSWSGQVDNIVINAWHFLTKSSGLLW